jgi:hypothetical protein
MITGRNKTLLGYQNNTNTATIEAFIYKTKMRNWFFGKAFFGTA